MFVPHKHTQVQYFVERIARTLRPQRGSFFEASFDFQKWNTKRPLISVAHARYLDNQCASDLSAGLQYLSTYLDWLHTAYVLWSSSVKHRLTCYQRKIAK